MQFKLAIITLIVLLGLSYSCFEKPKNNDLIVLRSNTTRETYVFDLNRLTLKDFQKTVEGEVISSWVSAPLKFTFHLMKCGPKSDYIPRRGHLLFNNQWIPMSKPCNDIAPKVFHRIDPNNAHVHMFPTRPKRFEHKKLHHMRRASQKPSFGQRFMNKIQRWGGKPNQEGRPRHRHFAHNHPDKARHEHRPNENNQRPPMGPLGASIHQGYVSLLQTTPKSKPIGFTLTFNSERPVQTRTGGSYNIVAKVNVVCQREGDTENPKLTLLNHVITNNVYTITFLHHSYAGCPQMAPEKERHEVFVAPMFFLFFLCSCCCQLLPCIAIICAIFIAIKKIQQIRKRNALIAMQANATALPQIQQPRPMVPVQFMPQPQPVAQPIAQPVQKKEERKPMQQVGVPQQQQQIELRPVVLPPMQPQFVQPPPQQQQPQYAFYPQLYPQVFVYPQQ